MITVLLATRNRAPILSSTLESYENLVAPPRGWKLVVIDNGSTDATPQVLTAFATRLPLIRAFEERAGKNRALNTGLHVLEGDLAVFTDDDVFPDPNWLIRLREAADANRLYSIFGGAILPRWEIPPPEWLNWVDKASMFAVTDPHLADGPASGATLFGPNLTIRAEIFKRGARFDVSIGPRGADYPMGSETELVQRLVREGHRAWHVQGARVEHFIEASHLTQRWVLNRAINMGRGQYRLTRTSDSSAARWPLYVVSRMLKRGFRIARAWMGSNERELLTARWELNLLWGHFVQARADCGRVRPRDAEEAKQASEQHLVSSD